jgi:hypothetical protein
MPARLLRRAPIDKQYRILYCIQYSIRFGGLSIGRLVLIFGGTDPLRVDANDAHLSFGFAGGDTLV